MRKAIDTETTGVDFFHGCRPFFISIAREDGVINSRQWQVDPKTRMPLVPVDDKQWLWDELHNPADTLLMHNAKFDMRACHTILPDMHVRDVFDRVHDTLLKHHCLDSSESHKLKDAALKYGSVPDDDQQDLKEAVNKARTFAKKLGWAVASKHTLPLQKAAPKDGWWVVDMWLPAAYMAWYWEQSGDDDYAPPECWENPEDAHFWWRACGIYCDRDTVRTLVLDNIFQEALNAERLNEVYEERRRLLPVVYEMEQRGITLDLHQVEREIVRCEIETDRYGKIAGTLLKRPKFNPRSDKQLQDALFNQLGLPVIKTTEAGNPSTDKDVMSDLLAAVVDDADTDFSAVLPQKSAAAVRNHKKLCHDVIINVVTAKKHHTAISYLDGYKRAARTVREFPKGVTEPCHGSFLPTHLMMELSQLPIEARMMAGLWSMLHQSCNITGTATTRFSSNNPNMQNVGKGKEAFIDEIKQIVAELTLRKVFGPAPWREWWAVDGKQLQLVIFAYVSQQKQMIAALERGEDLHDFVQRVVFGAKYDPADDGQRRIAKAVNFGRIFGAGDSKIEMTARMPGLCAMLDERLPGIKKFMAKNSAHAIRKGYVEAAGYRLVVPPDAPHAATNYIVQGWEGRIVQRAMLYWDEYIRANCPNAFMTIQVHDEIIVDFPKGEGDYHIAALCDLFRQAGRELSVPCDVDAKYIESRWDKGIPVEVAI